MKGFCLVRPMKISSYEASAEPGYYRVVVLDFFDYRKYIIATNRNLWCSTLISNHIEWFLSNSLYYMESVGWTD